MVTCAIVYGYGEDYKILSLLTSSIESCYNNFLTICPDPSSIASDSRLTFWFDLRRRIKDEGKEWMLHFSRHIAAFCFVHKRKLTKAEFESMTCPAILSEIHPEAAEQLLQVELELANQQNYPKELSDLQVRCIDVIAKDYKRHECSMDRLVCLSPLVLSTLLKKIAKLASSESSRLEAKNRIEVCNVPDGDNSDAQGLYYLDPNCTYGTHCFFKKGQWKSTQSCFYLYVEQDYWRIAVLYPGPNPGQYKCDLLYNSCAFARQTSIYQPTIRFL
jgi:hypothetical protein